MEPRYRTALVPALVPALVAATTLVAACTQPSATAQQAPPAAAAPTTPPAATSGDAPQTAKHHFVKQGQGKVYPRDLVTTEAKLSGPMTDGRFNYLDEIWKPGFVVRPHFHIEHAETFYILAGQVEWTVNGETQTMGPGDVVYIPPDTVHAVKVVGSQDVRTLMIYAPGGFDDHLEEEQRYTPEQRKQPDTIATLRSHFDFNVTEMPKVAKQTAGFLAPPMNKPGVAPVIRPPQIAPQPSRHHFSLKAKGETFNPENEVSEVKLSAAITDGRYSFLDEIWKPGMAVPPHFHSAHAEIFYIVAGQVEWTVGGETQVLGAGDLVYIPPDTVHAVKVVGDKDVQSLMLYTPGGYEYHSRREAQYTAEQRKQPEILKMLREQNDFHPVTR